MKPFLFFITTLIFSQGNSQNVQIYNTLYGNINEVFNDNANIRLEPSLKGKIIGTLKQKESYERCDGSRWKNDTIGNNIGNWRPIKHNGSLGYIWSGTLASHKLNGSINKDFTYLFQIRDKRIKIKVFNKDKLINQQTININTDKNVLGVTLLSNKLISNKELITINTPGDENKLDYSIYELNKNSFSKSEIVLKDDSYLTGIYKQFPFSIINTQGVNLREDTSLTSKVTTTLKQFEYVKLIEEGTRLKLNNEWGKWIKVKWKGHTGFIWDKFLSIPYHYVQSNWNDLAILGTSKGLYILKDKTILKFYENYWYSDGLRIINQFENDPNKIIFSTYSFGGACGKFSGDNIYLWNGNKVIHLGANGGIGDGGLSEGMYTEIRKDEDTNTIIYSANENGESLSYPKLTDCDYNSKYIIDYKHEMLMKIENDTLAEIPSKYKTLRDWVKSKYKGYTLTNYVYGDINTDGIEDVLAIITKELTDYSYPPPPRQSKALVLLGNHNDNYILIAENKSIFGEKHVASGINLNNSKISIEVLYNLGYDVESFGEIAKFNYEYNASTSEIVWKSKNIYNQKTRDWNSEWTKRKYYYNKNKILFQNSWEDNEY